jgi:PIN domain nuclease of toxin-antitoxin system
VKVLLDTHVFLWWAIDDQRLPVKLRHALESPDNVVFLSSASVWEIVIKQGLGRIRLPDNPADWLQTYLTQYGLLPLTIEHAHVLAIRDLPPKHRDPFDRVLIAQALCEGMALATEDRVIRQYDVPVLP